MGTLGSQASWFNTAWMVSCWKDLMKIETSQVPGGLERIVSRSVDGIKRNNSTAVWTLEPWISVYWVERSTGEPVLWENRVWVCTDRCSHWAE